MALSHATAAHAAWSDEALRWGDELNTPGAALFPEGATSTVWGSVQRQVSTAGVRKQIEASGDNETFFYPKGFESSPPGGAPSPNRFRAYFDPRRDSRGKIKRAPLVVVLTGIFGHTEDPVAASVISVWKAREAHVLSINNAWTPRYQSFAPAALPGEIREEARIVLDVVEEATLRIPSGYVSSVSLVGVSYGGFLAAAVAGLDAEAQMSGKKGLIDKTITLISPPIDFSGSMGRFDRGFSQMWANHECQGQPFLRLALDFWNARQDADLHPKHRACADYQVFRIFHEELVKLAHSLHETKGLGQIPSKQTQPDQYLQWKRGLNFSGFVDEYLGGSFGPQPSTEAPDFSEGLLANWLKKIPEYRRKQSLRVLASLDDFINAGAEDWGTLEQPSELRKLIPPESLILLNWGGHYGFSAVEGFREIL